MIKPQKEQILPKFAHSRQKIWFKCDCGRRKQIIWKNYNTNHTKSCGLCKSDKFQLKHIKNRKFGRLYLDTTQDIPDKILKSTKLNWICDCGNNKRIAVSSIINRLTKSCGCLNKKHTATGYVHPKRPKEYWLNKINSLIDNKLPPEWSKGSGIICTFICKCNNKYKRKFSKWKKVSTCGKCKIVNLMHLKNKKFGSLTISNKNTIDTIHIGSEQKIWFDCDCGNSKLIKIGAVTRGNTKTCNQCNSKPKQWWLDTKFGHLTVIKCGDDLSIGSERKLKCACSCGNKCYKSAYDISSGHTSTCGSCYDVGNKWWNNKLSPILGRHYSIEYLDKYFVGSFLKPLDSAKNANTYLRFVCKLCNGIFRTKLSWIWHSKIISCGCVKGKISRPNIEIAKFIEKLGRNVIYGVNELCLDKYYYDVATDDLIIEYHSLRYHSEELRNNKKIQLKKYCICKEHNYRFMAIYEDEWREKKEIILNIIKNKLGKSAPQFKIRPQQCSIKLISNKIAKPLLQSYHYQGHVNSTHNIGVYLSDKLIACLSIKHPSRQNSGDWEISRLVCDFDYKIYGLWSYLIKWVKTNQIIIGKLVTFSDNRLFDGDVYNTMGMTIESGVRPDYYWTDNRRRYHKSSFRRRKNDTMTETELRQLQGYHKIWDYGKTKWSILIKEVPLVSGVSSALEPITLGHH